MAAAAVVVAGGAASASNTNPPDPLFGTGASGTGAVLPDCPDGQVVAPADESSSSFNCIPMTIPIVDGVVPLATDATCPVQGDLEHSGPDPDDDTANGGVNGPLEAPMTFTDPTQMKTLLECILPIAVRWMTYEYEGSLTPPPEWESIERHIDAAELLLRPYGRYGWRRERRRALRIRRHSEAYCPAMATST